MALSLAKLLRDACDNSCGDVSYRSDYSGRGMYGRRCIGIDGSGQACLEVIAEVSKQLLKDVAGKPDMLSEAEDVTDVLLSYNSDSMGMGVIYYWKNAEDIDENGDAFEDDEVDEDDEE